MFLFKIQANLLRSKLQNKMLKEQFRELKRNAIFNLCQASADGESVLVQVYNIQPAKGDKVICFISDGHNSIKAFFRSQLTQSHQFALIRIKQHLVGDSGKKIGILDFELICQYNQMIGNPKPIDLSQLQNPQETKPFQLQLKNITTYHTNITNITQTQNKPSMRSAIKKEQIKQEEKKQMRQPVSKPLSGSVKDYETIKDLFVGLRNWHLLCRIIKLDYQEFQKKNSDKMVRVLNIDLIDRSDVKISGVFFYEAADKFKDELKLNSVYKISQGSINSQNYNNSKNDKMSSFRLIFGTNAVFQEISDVNIISRPQNSANTLAELLEKQIYDQQFDIVGILIDIQEAKQITKGDKVLKRSNWTIADPIAQKRIHAVIWNDKIKADSHMIGKTIILSRFALHNYNGSLTLNSKVRSSIQLATQHPYQLEQDRTMSEYSKYELVSERKTMVDEGANKGVIYKNLKELNEAVQYLPMGESLRSDLDIWVNRLMMKKWFYDGCPSCNKSAQKGTNCHCGKYVQQTVPHFIMSIEISDAYGSIWTTAYDEQSKRIFWEQQGVIHKLMKFDQNQLKEIVEDYLYQEFKVRLYTKKDDEGRIKHVLGKMEQKNPEKSSQDNVQMIKAMMGLAA